MGKDPREIEAWPAWMLDEFQQYDVLEPFGAWRDNLHAAIIAHIFASAYTRKGRTPPSVRDFMYKDPYQVLEAQTAAADAFFFPKG